MMNFLIIFFLCFFFTLSYLEFKKAIGLKGFNTSVQGKVTGITQMENGVFFEITYKYNGENKDYQHCFTKKKLLQEKVQFLAEHYLDSPFYMVAKIKDNSMLELKAYSNAKIMSWVYLLGGIATSSWFLM